MWAARRGHREVLDLLVRKEADLKLVDDASNSILHWACYGGNMAMVKHIISKNMVDINSKGQGGRSPLMWAAREGKRKIFDVFFTKGGLLSDVDNDGNNILLLACLGGNVKIVNNILSLDAAGINVKGQSNWTPLMAAAHNGHGKVFDLLVNTGADLTVLTNAGDDVLHVACVGGHVDIVSRVLEQDKLDINSRGQCSRTPLMVAASLGHKQIFDLLVNKGADTTLGDFHSNNILHLACEGEHLEIVQYILKEKMVDPNANNDHNQKAEMLTTNRDIQCKILLSRQRISACL
ncbi:ankyrin repeat domain-containing protein 17-like [Haliotis rufescens]|uniref:ankyrin repeat domain-containing protein 17-like n=1 Tax=Haliotis rufescens TaxID=6454 RepID=UPI00201E8A01|nr:ankyrin repeat domain-containing protein 17-like [Haliotis rufescens]XP_048246280.1 ankyrin repeat domain-containing protein 17-like [Haliotis rufescens]